MAVQLLLLNNVVPILSIGLAQGYCPRDAFASVAVVVVSEFGSCFCRPSFNFRSVRVLVPFLVMLGHLGYSAST